MRYLGVYRFKTDSDEMMVERLGKCLWTGDEGKLFHRMMNKYLSLLEEYVQRQFFELYSAAALSISKIKWNTSS